MTRPCIKINKIADDVLDDVLKDILEALVDGMLDHDAHESAINMVRKNPRLWGRLEALYYQKYLLKEWWRSLPLA